MGKTRKEVWGIDKRDEGRQGEMKAYKASWQGGGGKGWGRGGKGARGQEVGQGGTRGNERVVCFQLKWVTQKKFSSKTM